MRLCAWFMRCALAALLAAAAPGPVQAARLFTFDYFLFAPPDGAEISAGGILTTTDLDPISHTYTVTGITGTRFIDGVPGAIFGLAAGANLLYANQPWLDYDGLYFQAVNPFSFVQDVNLYYDPDAAGYTENWLAAGYGFLNISPLQATPDVPEPSTLLLLVSGLFAVRYGRRSRLTRFRPRR
jgi:hypothetical protein